MLSCYGVAYYNENIAYNKTSRYACVLDAFVRRRGVYGRSGILWCGKKQKMDAFRISYFLCNRKRSALFNDTFLCYLIIQL